MYDIGLFTYKTMTSKLKTDVLLYLGWLLYRLLGNRFFFFASRQPAAHGHIQRGIGHCYHRTIGLEVFLQQHHRGLRFQKIRELAPKWGYQKRTQLCLFFLYGIILIMNSYARLGSNHFALFPSGRGLEDWPFRIWTPGRHPTVWCQADSRKPPKRGMYGCRAFNMFIK